MKVIVDIEKTEIYKETIEFKDVACRLRSDSSRSLKVILLENRGHWSDIHRKIFDFIIDDLNKKDIRATYDQRELIIIPDGMEFMVKENLDDANIVELSVHSVSRSVRRE